MSYQDVRGPDGRLLFRFDPDRSLVEMRLRGETYVVDLTLYPPTAPEPAVINYDPLDGLSIGGASGGSNLAGGIAAGEPGMLY